MVKIWYFIAASLWIVSLVMFTVAREFILFNQAVLGAAIGLSALIVFLQRKNLSNLVRKPFFRMAITSGFRVFVIVCILAMVNYLAVKTSRVFDMTSAKLHTLSEQSRSIAKQVEKDLTITLFAKRGEWESYLSVLRQYENVNGKIDVKAVDVEENPSLTKLNNIDESGTITLESGGRKIKGPAKSELDITNLILKTLRDKKLVLYYTVGHGELERDDQEAPGGSFLFSVLNDASYDLKPLDMIKLKKVPEDADAVLALGPKTGMLDLEAKVLEKYLERGGNIFMLLGPNFKKANLRNLRNLLAKRGIKHHDALVLDRLSAVQGANATIPIVNRYDHEHTATKNFSGRTLFPLSAALEKEEKAKNTKYYALALSSPFPASWAESSINDINSGKVYYNKGLDIKGPVALMAASENSKDFGKIAVSASSDFVSNAYQNQSSNFNLFMNVLAWLMDDEGIISLNRPKLSQNMIILSAPQISLIFYFSIIFLPFAFFALAVWIYRRRLNK